ncbi:MAG: DUF192 domain-containing protein [Phycisphaerales bacterium]|nr:DUF192 domain-containing protein [Phycisphaerales bacterium]MCB9837471.1 DUF192 domain-containing protein [Phycisphaera sp.]
MALGRRVPLIMILVSAVVAAAAMLTLQSCSDAGGSGGASSGLVRIDIPNAEDKPQSFFLEPALDNETRFKGLSDRTTIDDDGGMIFVFNNSSVRKFVMRDCPIPIDIVYVDNGGRVIELHAMVPEEPQKEGESDRDYEERLKRYSSRYACDVVIELQGGMIEKLGLEKGEVVKIHGMKDLKARTK